MKSYHWLSTISSCMKGFNLKMKVVFYQEHDIKIRLRDAAIRDPDGIKGTYLKINKNLNCPKFYTINMINENDRNILTKI